MTAKLIGNNHDGANFQAQAVLAMVRHNLGDGIEKSWDDKFHRYSAEPMVHRFDNCREQGYVIYMRGPNYRGQINIAFYEHRNSDSIYVQVNNTVTLNAPSLDDITKDMSDKWQSSFDASVGKISEVADFISTALIDFWNEQSLEQSQ